MRTFDGPVTRLYHSFFFDSFKKLRDRFIISSHVVVHFWSWEKLKHVIKLMNVKTFFLSLKLRWRREERNPLEHIIKDNWESRRIIYIELFDLLMIERWRGQIRSNVQEHRLEAAPEYALNFIYICIM